MKSIPLLLALLVAAPAAAETFQDLDRLETRLTNALDAGIGQPGGPLVALDRRMKLIACTAPIVIEPPAQGAVALRCPSAGWRIRVPLAHMASSLSTASAAGPAAPPLVRRGDPVELVAASRDFSVSVSGIAQEDGAQGARIRVKTDPRSPPMFAEVIDAGRVALPGFK